MEELEHRQRRLDRARALIRAEFAVAVLGVILPGLWYVARPGEIGPMFLKPPPFDWVPLMGIAGVISGFAWMVRLSRHNPEAGERTWRYRDF